MPSPSTGVATALAGVGDDQLAVAVAVVLALYLNHHHALLIDVQDLLPAVERREVDLVGPGLGVKSLTAARSAGTRKLRPAMGVWFH